MPNKQGGISSELVAVAWSVLNGEHTPLIRLSDADAVIAAKDVEIEQLTLYKNLADEYGLSVFADLKEQSAALKLAREAIELEHDFGCCALYVERRDEALAAIDALKGE